MAPADSDKPIRFCHWLLVGGRGTRSGVPPTPAALLRMASERKAAYREEQAFKAARKKARAELEERWGRYGAQGLFDKVTGKNQRIKPGRRELMALYGPQGTERDDDDDDDDDYDSDYED